jgi:hypothetical protein
MESGSTPAADLADSARQVQQLLRQLDQALEGVIAAAARLSGSPLGAAPRRLPAARSRYNPPDARDGRPTEERDSSGLAELLLLKGQLRAIEARLGSEEGDLLDLHMADLRTRLIHAESQQEAGQAELEGLRHRIADLTEQLRQADSAASRTELGAELQQVQRHLSQNEQEVAFALQQLHKTRSEFDHTNRRLERLQGMRAVAEDKRARIQVLREGLRGPVDRRPVRELALSALGELGVPVRSSELTAYITARFGREMATNRLATLRRDEERAYVVALRSDRSRPVWLAPGLRSDATADRGMWTRSDWPLERRSCADPQLVLLLATRRLLELALEPPEDCADLEGLFEFVAELSEPWSSGQQLGPESELTDRHARLELDVLVQLPDGTEVSGVLDGGATTPLPDELAAAMAEASSHEALFGVDHGLDL